MMKIERHLVALSAFLLYGHAHATTYTPVQLLNPIGSSSGQAIVSTGPSSPPAWGGIGVNGIAAVSANTVIANATGSSASPTAFLMPSCSSATSALQWTSGSGFTCYTSSATLGSNTFTGTQTISTNTPVVILNDGSGTNYGDIRYQSNGTLTWALRGNSNAGAWTINRYNSGSLIDSPISISNSTGLVTFGDGIVSNSSSNAITGGTINNTTIGATTASAGTFTTLSVSSAVSGTGFSSYLASPPAIGGTAANSGAFTSLSASGTVNGAGFSNYLASPPAIGSTTANSGRFTTVTATSTITPSSTAGIVGTNAADNANAGSIGEFVSGSTSGTSVTSGTALNCASASLTAGDWDVQANISFNGATGTAPTSEAVGVSTTSATLGSIGSLTQIAATFGTGAYNQFLSSPIFRINVSSTTTVYAVGQAFFSGGTMTCNGLIRARRVR